MRAEKIVVGREYAGSRYGNCDLKEWGLYKFSVVAAPVNGHVYVVELGRIGNNGEFVETSNKPQRHITTRRLAGTWQEYMQVQQAEKERREKVKQGEESARERGGALLKRIDSAVGTKLAEKNPRWQIGLLLYVYAEDIQKIADGIDRLRQDSILDHIDIL